MKAIFTISVAVGLLIGAVYGQFIQTGYNSIQSNTGYQQCDFSAGGLSGLQQFNGLNGYQQGQGFNTGINQLNNLQYNSAASSPLSNLYRQRVQSAGLSNGQLGFNSQNSWGVNNQNLGLPYGQQNLNGQLNSQWGLNNQNGFNTGSGQWGVNSFGNSGQLGLNSQNSLYSQLFGNGNTGSWANNNNYNGLQSNLGSYSSQYGSNVLNPGYSGFSRMGNSFRNYWNDMNAQNNIYNNRNMGIQTNSIYGNNNRNMGIPTNSLYANNIGITGTQTNSLYGNQYTTPYRVLRKRKRRQALANNACRCLSANQVPNFTSVFSQPSNVRNLNNRNQYFYNTSGRCQAGTYCMCTN